MHPIERVLLNVPFMGYVPELYIIRIFAVIQLHTFHMGISKLINQCICDCLRSSKKYTNCTSKGVRKLRQFRSVTPTLLKQLIFFIDNVWDEGDYRKLVSKVENGEGYTNLKRIFRGRKVTWNIRGEGRKENRQYITVHRSFVNSVWGRKG